MKKIIPIFYILNILCGLITIANYELLYKFNESSILILFIFVIFYIASLILYFKNRNEISRVDLVVT